MTPSPNATACPTLGLSRAQPGIAPLPRSAEPTSSRLSLIRSQISPRSGFCTPHVRDLFLSRRLGSLADVMGADCGGYGVGDRVLGGRGLHGPANMLRRSDSVTLETGAILP